MDLITNLKSEKVFKCGDELRVFGLPDEEISGVIHIYAELWAKPNEYHREFKPSGILAGNTVYDASSYSLTKWNNYDSRIKDGSLEDERKKLAAIVSEKATKQIFSIVHGFAVKEIAIAETDVVRMKAEHANLNDDNRHFDYRQHSPQAIDGIIREIVYPSDKAHYAFYENKPIDPTKTVLVNAGITTRDTLRYLANSDPDSVLQGFVDGEVATAKKALANYMHSEYGQSLISSLAEEIIKKRNYDKLVADTTGEHNLIREIYSSVHCEALNGAKTVNVTVNIDGTVFTFNIERCHIRHDRTISDYYINPAKVREELKLKLKERAIKENGRSYPGDVRYSDILEITYKKKAVYKKQV